MASLHTLGMVILIYGIIHFSVFLFPFVRLHRQGQWSFKVAAHLVWAMFWISLGFRMFIAGPAQGSQPS